MQLGRDDTRHLGRDDTRHLCRDNMWYEIRDMWQNRPTIDQGTYHGFNPIRRLRLCALSVDWELQYESKYMVCSMHKSRLVGSID